MATNYYDVLGIPKDADNKAISEAYKRMALKNHPDKNPDNVEEANQRFIQISQAYQVLSDSNKRSRYDRGQSVDRHNFFYDDDDDDETFFHFVSPEMIFRMFFQQFEERMFRAHPFNDQRSHKCNRNRKAEKNRQRERKRESDDDVEEEQCQIRMVNGKQWMTKTYYENGKKIVTRYEEGELISKQVNGVFQKI